MNASAIGVEAERAAARKYGLVGIDEDTGHYDLWSTNGVHYQVKSVRHTRSNGNPGKLRFWKDHFEKLHRERSAVILVLTTDSADRPILKIEKVSTDTIREAIDDRWYASGHADGMGEQYKLPWRDVLTY